MTDPERLSDDEIEALVRRHLEREAKQVDPRVGLERLGAAAGLRLPRSRSRSRSGARPAVGRVVSRRRLVRNASAPWVVGLSATALACVLVALELLQARPAVAGAEVLVREAEQAHLLPLDRCYLVEFQQSPDFLDRWPSVPFLSPQHRLWTRGDRFWVEASRAGDHYAWGRDERNRFWIVFGSDEVLWLEPDEMPRWLPFHMEIYCVRLTTLLGSLLRDHVLERETPPDGAPQATLVIRATLKPGHENAAFRNVVLEIDAETRVVRRMTLERYYMGQFFANVTYTLVETRTINDRDYVPVEHRKTHGDANSEQSDPARRRALLVRAFGGGARHFRLRGED
jgi:hypothetical protein